MKIIYNLMVLFLLVFMASANARVLDATEEITITPAAGSDLFLGNLGDDVVFNGKMVTSGTANAAIPCNILTTVQRDALTPANGDCVFNDTTKALNTYNGATWDAVGSGSGGLGKWVTATAYVVDDIIWEALTEQIYRANTGHTAGATFVGDVANWDKLSYPDGFTDTMVPFSNSVGRLIEDANLSYTSGSATFNIQDISLIGSTPEVKSSGTDQDLTISGNGTGSVLVEGVSILDNAASAITVNGDLDLSGNGTGSVLFSTQVQYTSVSSPGTPLAGNLMTYVDTTSGLFSYKDGNGVERSVKDFKQSDVLTNSSFEDSHAGAPDLGWTCVGGSAAVETTERVLTEGAQSLAYTVTASTFSCSQTFDCSKTPTIPVGFLAYINSTEDVQVCGFDGTNDTNCVTPTSDDAFQLALAETTGGSTCGIKIKSDASITDVIFIDGVKFTDQPYRFVDVQNTTEWETYTPVFQGLGTPTSVFIQWRRVGSNIEISGNFDAGTVSAAEVQIGLPNSYTVDSGIGAVKLAGTFGRGASGASVNKFPIITAGDSFINFANQFGGTAETPIGGTSLVGNGEIVMFHATVPIEGLSASAKHVAVAFKSNLTGWTMYTPVIVGFGTPTGVEFYFKQIGDSYHIKGSFTAGTTTAVEAQLGLPGTSTVMSGFAANIAGFSALSVAGTTQIFLISTGGDAFLNIGKQGAGDAGLTIQDGNASFNPGESFSFTAIVPIEGLTSNATIIGTFPVLTPSVSVDASEVLTENDNAFVTSCTNADPSVCTFSTNYWKNDPKCWAESTLAGDISSVTLDTTTSASIDRTSDATPFKLFCTGIQNN